MLGGSLYWAVRDSVTDIATFDQEPGERDPKNFWVKPVVVVKGLGWESQICVVMALF